MVSIPVVVAAVVVGDGDGFLVEDDKYGSSPDWNKRDMSLIM